MRRLIVFILLLTTMHSFGQMNSDFKILPDEGDGEIIYQGNCSFDDLATIPAFSALKVDTVYFHNEENKRFLKEHLPGYEIVVLMGTWCSDSQAELPQFYEIVKDSGFPLEHLEIIALDRDKKGRQQEEEQYEVTLVPTFILMKEGQEAGRITEIPQKDLQQDLVDIIQKNKQ